MSERVFDFRVDSNTLVTVIDRDGNDRFDEGRDTVTMAEYRNSGGTSALVRSWRQDSAAKIGAFARKRLEELLGSPLSSCGSLRFTAYFLRLRRTDPPEVVLDDLDGIRGLVEAVEAERACGTADSSRYEREIRLVCRLVSEQVASDLRPGGSENPGLPRERLQLLQLLREHPEIFGEGEPETWGALQRRLLETRAATILQDNGISTDARLWQLNEIMAISEEFGGLAALTEQRVGAARLELGQILMREARRILARRTGEGIEARMEDLQAAVWRLEEIRDEVGPVGFPQGGQTPDAAPVQADLSDGIADLTLTYIRAAVSHAREYLSGADRDFDRRMSLRSDLYTALDWAREISIRENDVGVVARIEALIDDLNWEPERGQAGVPGGLIGGGGDGGAAFIRKSPGWRFARSGFIEAFVMDGGS